jgi:hypothetical protein
MFVQANALTDKLINGAYKTDFSKADADKDLF